MAPSIAPAAGERIAQRRVHLVRRADGVAMEPSGASRHTHRTRSNDFYQRRATRKLDDRSTNRSGCAFGVVGDRAWDSRELGDEWNLGAGGHVTRAAY